MDFLLGSMELLQWGWHVFPLAPGEKVPAIRKDQGGRGVLDATDDLEIIEDWYRRFPRANVGLACGEVSGIIVVDVDKGADGHRHLRELADRGQKLPATVTSRTANGGWHLFYRFESGPKNSKSLLARGVDIRTTGGYVVAPPSSLSGGRRYHWHRAPLGQDLPVLPRWAVEKLKPRDETPFYREQRGEPGDIEGLLRFLHDAPSGERNAILYWCSVRCGEAIALGEVSETEAIGHLTNTALSIGLSRNEIQKTVRSGLRKGARR